MSRCGSELPILGGTPAGGGGSGNVVGPALSTDNAVARWDGATGQLLQNSVVIISDTGGITLRRIFATLGGNIVAGDFTLSAGLGNTASISSIAASSKDTRFRFTLTVNGTGIAANPTLTLTWHDGSFVSTPFANLVRNGGTGLLGFTWVEAPTTLVITLAGTPLAGETYIFQGQVIA